MASGKRLDLGRTAYSGDKETGKLLKMSHEKTFQPPFLVVIKESEEWEGGIWDVFSKSIQLFFKDVTPKANIFNDCVNGISLGFFLL